MTAAVDITFSHGGPWTDEEYFALGETPDRIELFDGSLVVTPPPSVFHQRVSRRLANLLDAPAQSHGLEIYEAINARLKAGRVCIPDIVATTPVVTDDLYIDGSALSLVCEIVSPSNAATDRVLKMHYYAEAGIPWYLIVERQPELTLTLFTLVDGKYVRAGHSGREGVLRLVEPFALDINVAVLEK